MVKKRKQETASKKEDTSSKPSIVLRGAGQNNLKNIDLTFPLGELTVICGVSGSGKSSLAFETLYAEGQRRYIESFSAYTRQFLQRLDKPKFDYLEPLPPSISVTRDNRGSRNNRSTVGTACELLEYLRTVYANRSELYCTRCDKRVEVYTPEKVLETLKGMPASRCSIGFDVKWQGLESLVTLLADLQSEGFVRLIVSNTVVLLSDSERSKYIDLFKTVESATVVVDRLSWNGIVDERMQQSIGLAWDVASFHEGSKLHVLMESTNGDVEVDGKFFERNSFSPHRRCDHCNIEFPEPTSQLFNFNHPSGACSECEGFGEISELDWNKIVPDQNLSLREGAIAPWRGETYQHELNSLIELSDQFQIPVDTPVRELTASHWDLIKKGAKKLDFWGLNGFFDWMERRKYRMHIRIFLTRWKSYKPCPTCHGARLNPGSLAYRLAGYHFADICSLNIQQLSKVLSQLNNQIELNNAENQSKIRDDLTLPEENMWKVSEQFNSYLSIEPLRQVRSRVEMLKDIGLDYISLDRPMHSLSSGEAQRVHLTSLLGSSLVDMLYVFDEPTVGLHHDDVVRVIESIKKIRDRGNTVILVEHEPSMMRIADRVIEIGPVAGKGGGEVIFDGTPRELQESDSLTGKYLRDAMPKRKPLESTTKWIGLRGATGRNLKNCDIEIPVGRLTTLTGPSGAGKSSLLLDSLGAAMLNLAKSNAETVLPYRELFGTELIRECKVIDQRPIPRSSRGNPATYCNAMTGIRQVFAETPDAKVKRMLPGHFSFNNKEGRCSTCEGLGFITVEMQFMADVEVPCADCKGMRFCKDVLEVRYRDRNIHEILQLTVNEASDFFRPNRDIGISLYILKNIGLGYLPLGQRLSTLSAGEAMRLKLASVLASAGDGIRSDLILLDEPTTGLHFADIDQLLYCVDRLLELGKTVVMIEHNEQIIAGSDYVIEMGPGAGPNGGSIVSAKWNHSR